MTARNTMPLAMAAVAVVAGASGFLAGSSTMAASEAGSTARPTPAERSATTEPDPAPTQSPRESTRRDAPREEPDGSATASAPSVRNGADVGLFSPALMLYFDEGFRSGWASERLDPPSDATVAVARDQFQSSVRKLPGELGRRAAMSANKDDAARAAVATGDGIALVGAVSEGTWTPEPTDLDDALFERVFEPRTGSVPVNGEELRQGEWLSDGTLLTFGPGIHALNENRLRRSDRSTVPSDLTIVGAGMNRTILTMGDISSRDQVERLTIRDITLDCGNDYFFDLRRGPLTIDLERVRLVRFDMGAGGSLAFGCNEGALIRARDCEIAGGLGSAPGSGNLFRGAALVASFTNCRFAQVNLEPHGSTPGSVVYRDCLFERFVADPTEHVTAQFVGSTVAPLITNDEYRTRNAEHVLYDLFPGWPR